jgi:hypothetical protein
VTYLPHTLTNCHPFDGFDFLLSFELLSSVSGVWSVFPKRCGCSSHSADLMLLPFYVKVYVVVEGVPITAVCLRIWISLPMSQGLFHMRKFPRVQGSHARARSGTSKFRIEAQSFETTASPSSDGRWSMVDGANGRTVGLGNSLSACSYTRRWVLHKGQLARTSGEIGNTLWI